MKCTKTQKARTRAIRYATGEIAQFFQRREKASAVKMDRLSWGSSSLPLESNVQVGHVIDRSVATGCSARRERAVMEHLMGVSRANSSRKRTRHSWVCYGAIRLVIASFVQWLCSSQLGLDVASIDASVRRTAQYLYI
jgi:hypothetical protein